MKTKIFAFVLSMLCLLNITLAQSVALTGFNGRVQFNSFTNNGGNVRGTLAGFSDQTNQYFASDLDTNDIAWDNLGRRYKVVGIISSNLTQAVVDMERIGGGSHLPTGVGLVSRETSNGLTLIATANSTGISAQLMGRILTHNMKVVEGIKTIYTNNDSIVGNRKIGIAESARFMIGSFPLTGTVNTTHSGLFINASTFVGLVNRFSSIKTFRNSTVIGASNDAQNVSSSVSAYANAPMLIHYNVNSGTTNQRSGWIGINTLNAKLESGLSTYWTKEGASVGSKSEIDTLTLGAMTVNYATTKQDTIDYQLLGKSSTPSIQRLNGFTGPNKNPITLLITPPSSKSFEVGRSIDLGKYILFTVNYQRYLSNAIRFYDKYDFANALPSVTNNAKTLHVWMGDGSTTSPALVRFQNGISSQSTDVSGDVTVTIPTMPDATYSTNITVEGTTSYTVSVHTKTTTSFKVRFFNPTTGAAVASTSVSCSYKIEDY